MGATTKTIVRIFLLFFAFQICMNIFITTMPQIIENQTQDNINFLIYLDNQVNSFFDSEDTGSSLMNEMKSFIETTDLFNEGIINSFLGVLKVIGKAILFIVKLTLNILFTPGTMINILTYNFIANTGYMASLSIIVNVSFYLTVYYIIFKVRTNS